MENGIKAVDSPTQRDIYYKFDKGTFEFMIPPYNPLVAGHARKVDETTLKCESNDGKRTFIFHFDGALKPSCLNYIEMYRMIRETWFHTIKKRRIIMRL